jgi:hypothetical protein
VNPTKDQAPKNPSKKYGEAEYSLADDKENGARSLLIKLIKAKQSTARKSTQSSTTRRTVLLLHISAQKGSWTKFHECRQWPRYLRIHTHVRTHTSICIYVCVFIHHLNPKPQSLKPNPNLNPILFTNYMCVSLGHIYRRIVYMQVEFRSSGFRVSPSPVEGLGFSLTP